MVSIKKIAALLLILPCLLGSVSAQEKVIYHVGWIDFNKNGKKDVYEDPRMPVENRVTDLLSQMNMNEKTGQLSTLYGYKTDNLQTILPDTSWDKAAWRFGVANMDEHCNGSWGECASAYPFSERVKVGNTVQRWFVENTRLGIPVDFSNEGISGLAHTKATYFPKQIAQASTWNKRLVYDIGQATAIEAKALGYTNIYSPILDLARDPRWGRVVETYGEDPYLAGELGKQMVLGLQQNGVAATAKHFAVYSIPMGGRDGDARTAPQVPLNDMHTIFLEPFRVAVEDAGLLGVMVSYNDYDGIPLPVNAYMLKDILRKKWGFKGYVVTDSEALEFVQTKHKVAGTYAEAIKKSIEGGTNVRTFFKYPYNFYTDTLRKAAASGYISGTEINERVKDVLRVKFKLGLFDRPYVQDTNQDEVIGDKKHKALALQAALESIVLLKNQNELLPLSKNLTSLAVIGPNAAESNNLIHRYGPKKVDVVSVLDGIRKAVPNTKIYYAKGCHHTDKNFPQSDIENFDTDSSETKMIAEAVDAVRKSDAAVVVLGDFLTWPTTPQDMVTVGEAYTRLSLNLPGSQEKLLRELHRTGKPIVLILMNGRVMTINWADKNIPAILETWYLGENTGVAIADVLFGNFNPGGKLPVTVPKSVGQIPFAFPYKPASHLGGPAEAKGALYPFGFGLSYTSFAYSELKLSKTTSSKKDSVVVSVRITNTGKRGGDEIVQLYLTDEEASVVPFEKTLKGFERVRLKSGESKTVSFTLPPKAFQMLNRELSWITEPGWFTVQVGASSEDIRLKERLLVK